LRSNADLDARSSLGLSKVTKSDKPVRLKSWAMKPRAKRRVRGAARCLEAKWGSKNCSFATLTLPPSYAVVFDAKLWNHAFDLWKRRLRRRLRGSGIELDYVGVYEMHPDRSVNNGYPILHMHVVFGGRLPYTHWPVTPAMLTEDWKCSCEAAIGQDAPEASWNAACELKMVRKSVSAYLGKYLSKKVSGELAAFGEVEYQPWVPRNWVVIGAQVLQLLARNTVKLFGQPAAELIMWLKNRSNAGEFKHFPKFIKGDDGREIEVGGFFCAPDLPPIKLS